MATSLSSVNLPSKVWVDLYDATSILLGTKLNIQNLGSGLTRISESAVLPISTTGFNIIDKHAFVQSADTPVGVWAYATDGTTLQVEVA